MGLEDNYQRAIIKLARDMPDLIKALRNHTLAMTQLKEAINRMPQTLKVRY